MHIDPVKGIIDKLQNRRYLSIGEAGTKFQKIIAGTPTVTQGNISAATGAEIDVTVTGAAVGDAVFACPSTDLGSANLAWCARVKTTDTVSVRIVNPTAGTINPSDVAWRVFVVKF